MLYLILRILKLNTTILKPFMAIKSALESENCHVFMLEATADLPVRLTNQPLDIVFNIAEGTFGRGREAQVPAILNFFHIPFTGSDETTLCISLDKALTKRLLATYHIKTPKYRVISKSTKSMEWQLHLPRHCKTQRRRVEQGNLRHCNRLQYERVARTGRRKHQYIQAGYACGGIYQRP